MLLLVLGPAVTVVAHEQPRTQRPAPWSNDQAGKSRDDDRETPGHERDVSRPAWPGRETKKGMGPRDELCDRRSYRQQSQHRNAAERDTRPVQASQEQGHGSVDRRSWFPSICLRVVLVQIQINLVTGASALIGRQQARAEKYGGNR